jgi:sulfhydrogenase subunit beta (sulfur reductase)
LKVVDSSGEENRRVVLERSHFPSLLDVLTRRGYRVYGPTPRWGAIVYGKLSSVEDLPKGYSDEQAGGTYRMKQGGGEDLFSYAASPHSWKKYLHPPTLTLWQAERTDHSFRIREETPPEVNRALIGVRACDLHAILIQDRILTGGEYVDPEYAARRTNLFIIAVHCGRPSGTCFCASMGTGPKAVSGFDLAMTEVLEEERHYFVVEIGTERGEKILQEVGCEEAGRAEQETAREIVRRASDRMGRSVEKDGLADLLARSFDHPRWEGVGGRCLNCANCTLVCPTCFCTTVEDFTNLKGEKAARRRRWDSCFTVDFSHLHGGSIRSSSTARYRQWMMHKLSTWYDQFGTTGCVGCGRCITWCPVAIDITEEARAIREERYNEGFQQGR